MTADRVTIKISLPGEQRDLWNAYCRSNFGTSGAATLLETIRLTLMSDKQTSPFVSAPGSRELAEHKKTIRLTSSEAEALEARRKEEGLSQSKWMVKQIRSALTRQPAFTENELDALDASNAVLVALSKQLRHFYSQLNDVDDTEQCRVLESARESINEQVALISQLIRSADKRWSIHER